MTFIHCSVAAPAANSLIDLSAEPDAPDSNLIACPPVQLAADQPGWHQALMQPWLPALPPSLLVQGLTWLATTPAGLVTLGAAAATGYAIYKLNEAEEADKPQQPQIHPAANPEQPVIAVPDPAADADDPQQALPDAGVAGPPQWRLQNGDDDKRVPTEAEPTRDAPENDAPDEFDLEAAREDLLRRLGQSGPQPDEVIARFKDKIDAYTAGDPESAQRSAALREALFGPDPLANKLRIRALGNLEDDDAAAVQALLATTNAAAQAGQTLDAYVATRLDALKQELIKHATDILAGNEQLRSCASWLAKEFVGVYFNMPGDVAVRAITIQAHQAAGTLEVTMQSYLNLLISAFEWKDDPNLDPDSRLNRFATWKLERADKPDSLPLLQQGSVLVRNAIVQAQRWQAELALRQWSLQVEPEMALVDELWNDSSETTPPSPERVAEEQARVGDARQFIEQELQGLHEDRLVIETPLRLFRRLISD